MACRLATLACLLLWLESRAAISYLADLQYETASNAVMAASAGDTIVFPAGKVGWTNTLFATNLVLTGAGMTATVITNLYTPYTDVEDHDIIKLKCSTNFCSRITQMGFNGNRVNNCVTITYAAGQTNYPIGRIDHCRFDECPTENTLSVVGLVSVVVDHCWFVNNDTSASSLGKVPVEIPSWNYDLTLGSTNCTVFEDCVFLNSELHIISAHGSLFEQSRGSRTVIRKCVWTNSADNTLLPIIDFHGSQSATVRAQRQTEIYNNIFTSSVGADQKLTAIFGGTALIYSNQFIGVGFRTKFTVGAQWGDPTWAGTNVYTTYPCPDQHWLWFWGNTVNGTNITELEYQYAATDPVFFLPTTNVWWVAPSIATTPTYGTLPTSDAGMHVITNYAALTYPHPLVTSQDNPPSTLSVTGHARTKSVEKK